ncbi:hypothetical protein VE01_05515 [Pseudogymnoascus verrucosus]|uniref:DUF488 domain-containing protein n=1 Tax=Pseudogymnoascus verrucosus TaxID=342668 RepID=A0A1B8GM33_9PEZI|nr:uncharacterized protein VE01_05515 [Pseudogymnoascus verrucosus]OBT96903.1 hypothetical protein VE01_05515 [Pseudogymnoascus verrucosus]
MGYKIEKRRRRSSSPEHVDPKQSTTSRKRTRHGHNTRNTRSQSPNQADSPHPRSEYTPAPPSNLPEVAQASLIVKDETESLVLDAFPNLDISSPVPSPMSVDVDSTNPIESSDPDSPMPANATESESTMKLGSDVELAAFQSPEVLCVGYSTLPLAGIVELLTPMDVSHIVDIRSKPVSNVNPEFDIVKLKSSRYLMENNIEYLWLGLSLGGRRDNMEKDNMAAVIRHKEMLVPDLKNYAAYMTTREFKAGLTQLKDLAIEQAKIGKRVVIMCDEAVHWRCHRRMIADRLVADNWTVKHMGLKVKECVDHVMWNISRKAPDGEVVYDKPRPQLEN